MNNNFLITFSLFDFKTLKEKELKNNVRTNFLYEIHYLFNDHMKNSNSLGQFKQNIISSKNNKTLFYIGVENEAKQYALKYLHKTETLLNELFIFDSLLVETKITKIKIGKDKTKSLLCILKILNVKNTHKIQNNDEESATFILFPLKFADFH